jgi:eukaryotic-like serine/threonine-protein kinase
LFCPQCGATTAADVSRCTTCGATFAHTSIATGVLPIDTTGLPPGGTFGPFTDPALTGSETTFPTTDGEGDGGQARAPGGPLQIGEMFGPRYRIIRVLGVGGMGTVYHAWDAELGVAVALKVIRVDKRHASADYEKRFKNELLLARRVTHKNVVRIYDIGEIDGIKYITMSYLEGRDLATILRKQGKLPVREVLAYGRQIVAGLQAAHEANVIHRDLKPGNVMIAEGQAILMDFGIARGVTQPSVAETGAATMGPATPNRAHDGVTSAAVLGTLEYMAPEQARGGPLDQRVDIYAVGLILRDLLLGERPMGMQGASLRELQERLAKAPTPLRDTDPSIPKAVDDIIVRCLQTDPAARFQRAADLGAALDRLDANGKPLPAIRRLTRRLIAAAALVTSLLLGATFWIARVSGPATAVQRPPTSVLIADFNNQANDPVFEGSLENALAVGLEGASFITTYPRRDALRIAEQINAGPRVDERAARLVSMREGIKYVLSGTIRPRSTGYDISVRALDPSDAKEIATATARASDKNGVLRAVGTLASQMRAAFGDTASRSQRLAAGETLTASSLEAVQSYAIAQDLATAGRYAESIPHYKRAVEADPNFGRAYSGWATSEYRVGHEDQAADLYKRAFAHMDRMTEREKYRTLGGYYVGIAHDHKQAIENFEALVKAYPADGAGHNNLALAYFNTLNFQKALEEGRKALEIYPKRLLYRSNDALYAMYAGDFASARTEASAVVKENPKYAVAYLPLAIAALESGDRDAARQHYAGMAQAGAAGASRAALGLADIQLYEGRVDEAIEALKKAAADDEKAQNKSGAAIKTAVLAEAYELAGNAKAALTAARDATRLGRQDSVLVMAGGVLARLGADKDVDPIVQELGKRLPPQSRAYARILEARLAMRHDRAVDAIETLRAAQKLADVWIGRFTLGEALVDAGFNPQAISELELSEKRRGEASAAFLDDMPTFRYRAPLVYWLARAQDGIGQQAPAQANYRTFLTLRETAPRDPLAADARRRVQTR